MEKLIQEYCENGAKKLNKLVDKVVNKKFGGTFGKNMDDYYFIAQELMAEFWEKSTYDPSKGDFESFLYNSLWKAFIDENKRNNRDKRKTKIIVEVEEDGEIKKKKIAVNDVSLNAPIKEGEDLTYEDIAQSDFSIESVLEEINRDDSIDNVEKYLSSLPKITRQIIEMKMNNIPVSEIKKKLSISDQEYSNCMSSAKLNENIALFTKQSNKYREDFNMNIIPLDITDNYRMDKSPLGCLLDDMMDGKINRKHILQRKAYQWTNRQINKFLTRVLNGQPIPEIVICEQTIKNKKKSHLIDGLQRLSYSELFRADGISIGIDGAEYYEIPYKEYQYDEDGSVLLDEDGDAKFELKTFNVIGKKFSEFPVYLKERFNKFNVNVTTYFNCTDEQIAYHIRNYNNQEGMNKSQYEFTGLDVNTAIKIKNISDNHSFFKDKCGNYSDKNKIKGDIEKVVIESMMTINFLNDWKKETKDSFAYINKNSTDIMFESFEQSLDRLCNIVDKETKKVFTTTNSPVWFAVFDKFKTLNLPDIKFKDFIIYVSNNLDNLLVDGKSFKEIYKNRGTRDKSVVTGKINSLITLMYDFLHIEDNVKSNEKRNVDIETIDYTQFIKNNLEDITDDDIELFEMVANDVSDAVDEDSWMLSDQNRPSYLALVGYAIREDKDDLLGSWMTIYEHKNEPTTNQKDNFLHMKSDFDNYIANVDISA